MEKVKLPKVGARGILGIDTPYAPSPPPSILEMLLKQSNDPLSGATIGDTLSQALTQQPLPSMQQGITAPDSPLQEDPYAMQGPTFGPPAPADVSLQAAAAQGGQTLSPTRATPFAVSGDRSPAPPVPVFEDYQNPTPGVPLPPAPVRDAAAARKGQEDALKLALTLGALGSITGRGGHTADYITSALGGASAAADTQQKEAVADWQNRLLQAQNTNSLNQSHLRSANEVTSENNRNKEVDYTNRRDIFNTESRTEAAITKANNERDKAYRAFFTGLNPAAQESEVQSNPLAAQLGFIDRRDGQGNFIPYTTEANAIKRQAANTKQQDVNQKPGIQEGKNVSAEKRATTRADATVKGVELRNEGNVNTQTLRNQGNLAVAKLVAGWHRDVAAGAQQGAMDRVVLTQTQMNGRARLSREQKERQFQARFGTQSNSDSGRQIISSGARLSAIEQNLTRLQSETDKNPNLLTPETQQLMETLRTEHARVLAYLNGKIAAQGTGTPAPPTGTTTVRSRLSGRTFEVHPDATP